MSNWTRRTELLLGQEGLEKLTQKTVAVIGVGGVGSFTAEALARSGVGKLLLVDSDIISISNLNRQIHAMTSTLNQPKVEVMAARLRDINPAIHVTAMHRQYSPDTAEEIITPELDYVIDAVDMVSAKLHIICRCQEMSIPVISVMGTGNKLDPTRFEVVDISKTSICPLARVVRKELGRRGIRRGVKVVYSKEEPRSAGVVLEGNDDIIIRVGGDGPGAYSRQVPGSIAFVPSVAGLIAAGEVVRELVNINHKS